MIKAGSEPVLSIYFKAIDHLSGHAPRRPAIEFFTHLSVEECERRLADALDRERVLRFLGPRRPVGYVDDSVFYFFQLRQFGRGYLHSSVLYGKLASAVHGTHVSASFRIHPMTIATWTMSLGLPGIFLTYVILTTHQVFWLSGLMVVPIILFMLFVLIMLIQPLNQSTKSYLIEYLRQTLTE